MALGSISVLPEVAKLSGRPQKSFANGTHAVVLEVDPDTGATRVLRWIVAHDCGHVLAPGIVDGQIHGAVMQGR
jgi:aerobic carbon-monoxide dehydrogenase large subunit